jgi:tetratricopeptide (TPR) repeat protein
MFFRKALLLCLLVLFFAQLVYAEGGGIASQQEAVNYYNEGLKAQKRGDTEEALKAYQKALQMSAEYNKLIINNRGVMYAQQGDLKRAEATFKEVLALDPRFMPAKLNLGLIYDMQGDRLKALEYWAKVFRFEDYKPKGFVVSAPQTTEKDSALIK